MEADEVTHEECSSRPACFVISREMLESVADAISSAWIVSGCVARPRMATEPPPSLTLVGRDMPNGTQNFTEGNIPRRIGILRPAYSTVVQVNKRTEVAFARNAISSTPANAARTMVRAAEVKSCARRVPASEADMVMCRTSGNVSLPATLRPT